ncbi:MAG: hypothetical protein IJW88_04325 [Alistipes sp.]|nr:hypothetical protein [Alistipes sp.]
MELLEIIITTVLILVVSIISQSGKKKQSKQTTQQTMDMDDRAVTSSNSVDNNTTSTSSNTLTMMGTPVPTGQPARRSKNKKQPTTHNGVIDPQRQNNAPKTDSNEQDDNSFDLRKAVIYSEILTPKFKDEDF